MTKRERETTEYAAMVARMLDAYGRRVADADPEDLAAMLAMRERFDVAVGRAVVGQRQRHSWAQIGAALGITRQAAQMRWGQL